jgi:hypothetical protein
VKVIENTPDRLVLEDFPWPLAAWLSPPLLMVGATGVWLTRYHLPMGAILIGMALLFGLLLTIPVRLSRFVFSRGHAAVEITTASLWSRRARTIPLAEVAAAEVQRQRGRRRAGVTRVRLKDGRVVTNPDDFRPILRLRETNEKVPLHLAFTQADDSEARALVEAMNAWLAAGWPRAR